MRAADPPAQPRSVARSRAPHIQRATVVIAALLALGATHPGAGAGTAVAEQNGPPTSAHVKDQRHDATVHVQDPRNTHKRRAELRHATISATATRVIARIRLSAVIPSSIRRHNQATLVYGHVGERSVTFGAWSHQGGYMSVGNKTRCRGDDPDGTPKIRVQRSTSTEVVRVSVLLSCFPAGHHLESIVVGSDLMQTKKNGFPGPHAAEDFIRPKILPAITIR